jgi:hypothetical protein
VVKKRRIIPIVLALLLLLSLNTASAQVQEGEIIFQVLQHNLVDEPYFDRNVENLTIGDTYFIEYEGNGNDVLVMITYHDGADPDPDDRYYSYSVQGNAHIVIGLNPDHELGEVEIQRLPGSTTSLIDVTFWHGIPVNVVNNTVTEIVTEYVTIIQNQTIVETVYESILTPFDLSLIIGSGTGILGGSLILLVLEKSRRKSLPRELE